MASSSLRYRTLRPIPRTRITTLHLLILAGLSTGSILWGWLLLSGRQGYFLEYLILLGLFGTASATFIFTRTRENHLRFFDIPVFLTILVFVEFGLAPLECFVTPARLNYNFDSNYGPLIKALAYVTVGMVAFWAGCALVAGSVGHKEAHAPAVEQKGRRVGVRVLPATVGIYAVSFAVKVYLLTHHLYSYLESGTLYRNNLASMQVLMVVSGFGTYALVIACIESGLHLPDQKWKLIFWAIFASECFWGLVSGMKENLLQNFVIVALVSSLIRRKFCKGWVIAAVLGLVVMYPGYNAYRSLVRGQGQQVTSFEGARKAATAVVEETSRSGAAAELKSGWLSTVSRLDLLQSVGLITSLGPSARQLLGRERWWMLPFYPFIPRFIWHSKPALTEGGRFSVLLGYGGPDSTAETVGTSTAATYPGDLYIRGGMAGILLGMFVLGVVGQWLTSRVSGTLDRRRLFIYAAIFLTATDMEIDAFSYWSGLIKTFVILSIVAWLAYGARPVPAKKRATAKALFART